MSEDPLRFPRSARLLTAGDFRAVFRAGRRAHAGSLRARVNANGLSGGRLGMAVGRKAARGAVNRNRARRQIRESFRRRQHEMAGLDVVVSLVPSAGRGPGNLWPELARLWKAVVRSAEAQGAWKS